MQKCDIITGDQFKTICDDYLDEDKTYIDTSKKPKIIFLKTDWLEIFKQKVLPRIDYKFKLVTHNGDRSIPNTNIGLLEDSRLIKWYGMNCHIKHTKLQPIPIGIANEKWPHGDKNTLLKVINTEIKKTHLCYSNFDLTTNPIRRPEIYKIIQTKTFIDIDNQKHNYLNYLTRLKQYKYITSPPGNSVDCHRIWEAIYLGVIPIVEKHVALEYFEDLPILFVNSFNDITVEDLESNYQQLVDKSKEKTIMNHYINMINNNVKYFCLHHLPLTGRKDYLQERFKYLNLDVEWVTGFLPNDIEVPFDATFKNKAECSLYYKHLYCIEQQIKNSIEYVIVFEDDVLLTDDFNEHVNQCLREFKDIKGDLLFLGICCGIQPSNILPDKKVYWEPGFLTRCTHCYVITLEAAKKIHKYLLKKPSAYDYKLNETIQLENLKSCYGEPGIHQGTQSGKYISSLNN